MTSAGEPDAKIRVHSLAMKKTLALSFVAAAALATAAIGRAATAADNWDNNCAKCHGADGSGNTKIGKKLNVKDYTSAKVQADLKDADMFKAVKEGVTVDGKEKMRAFGGDLSDPEITDLVAYIRKMQK